MNGCDAGGGCTSQKITVMIIAATFANQPPVHQRISARRFDRVSTRKKIAIITDVATSPQMLNW